MPDGPGPVFTWLGTAGLRIEVGGKVILLDPFFSRGERDRPHQAMTPLDAVDADCVFVSHGHFDHVKDVPSIMTHSPAPAYCSGVTARYLEKNGIQASRIHTVRAGDEVDLGVVKVRIGETPHTRFDLLLIARTLPRVLPEFSSVLRAVRGMPSGPVLCFDFDFDGLRLSHVGSLGVIPPETLDLLRGCDILALPIQGRSDIIERAASVAKAVKPRAVLATHHDDFFPPLSAFIDVEPLRQKIGEQLPGCVFCEPLINKEFTSADIFG